MCIPRRCIFAINHFNLNTKSSMVLSVKALSGACTMQYFSLQTKVIFFIITLLKIHIRIKNSSTFEMSLHPKNHFHWFMFFLINLYGHSSSSWSWNACTNFDHVYDFLEFRMLSNERSQCQHWRRNEHKRLLLLLCCLAVFVVTHTCELVMRTSPILM